MQWSREGAFVWVVRDGKAARLPLRILQRADTEVLVDAAFLPGDLVIVEGDGAEDVASVQPSPALPAPGASIAPAPSRLIGTRV